MTTVTGVTTVNHLLLTLTFRYQTPFSPPTCSGADVNAARLFKTNMAIQSTGHPLHPLFQAMVGGRPDERLGAPPTTTTFTAPWQHHRIAAADAVIAAGAKVLREPIDDSQCPASTKTPSTSSRQPALTLASSRATRLLHRQTTYSPSHGRVSRTWSCHTLINQLMWTTCRTTRKSSSPAWTLSDVSAAPNRSAPTGLRSAGRHRCAQHGQPAARTDGLVGVGLTGRHGCRGRRRTCVGNIHATKQASHDRPLSRRDRDQLFGGT